MAVKQKKKVLFVRLFHLCLFGFVYFLFILVSGKGCGLWLWHSPWTFLLPLFRTGCSFLRYGLYLKSIIESPRCNCRYGDTENAEHLFFRCNLYRNHRQELIDTLSQHDNITLNVIFNGNVNLSNESNIPASILRKSTSGRHRPVSYPDGPMTARYRFT